MQVLVPESAVPMEIKSTSVEDVRNAWKDK